MNSSSFSSALSFAGVGILAPVVAGALAEFACRWNGRASASARHLIWALAFLAMAVCALATLVPLRLPLPILPAQSARAASSEEISPTLVSRSSPMEAAPPTARTPAARHRWQNGLFALWLSGFAAMLLTALAGHLRMRKLVERSRMATGQRDLWSELLSLLRLHPSVRLRVSAEVRVPILAGLRHPTVILPEAALEWPAHMLRAALLHELIHLRRNDLFWHTFARWIAAFYWFNPAAWYGLRSLQAQAEMATDDGVVLAEAEPIAYAESLLSVMRMLQGSEHVILPAIGMLEGRSVESRIERILDHRPHRQEIPAGLRLGTLFCGVLLTAGLLIVRPVAAVPQPVLAGLAAPKAAPHAVNSAALDTDESEPASEPAPSHAITDLKTQLAGTRWQATPENRRRAGLAAILTFSEQTVGPAGYRYEVNRHDGTVRIFFNHGDTQLMLLTHDGERLGFTFAGKDYAYELIAK